MKKKTKGGTCKKETEKLSKTKSCWCDQLLKKCNGLVNCGQSVPKGITKGWFPLRKTFLRTGMDRKVSFVLESLVPTESSQDKGNFPVRSRPEEKYPEWKPALRRLWEIEPLLLWLRSHGMHCHMILAKLILSTFLRNNSSFIL